MPDLITVRVVAVSLAILGMSGLVAVTLLLKWGVDPASVAIVSSLSGPAVGALCALLASTRGVPTNGVEITAPSATATTSDNLEV